MKKLYSTILIILIGVSGFAQNSEIRKGDKLFASRAYIDAAQAYEKVNEKDQEVLQNLGDAYFYTNQMVNAAEVYQLLFLRHEATVDPEYKFRYAHALMGIGKQDEADDYFSDYYGEEFNFEEFRRELDTTVSHVFTTDQVMNNAASADFGIAYYGDKVVFASTRNQERPIYPWDKRPTLDLYTADVADDKTLSGIVLFPGEINTDTHESSATFSEDGMTMYFTRTNEKRVENEDDVKEWYRHWIADGFTKLEADLARGGTGRFCHGESPTLADCCLVPQVFNAKRYQSNLAPYPKTMRVFEACMQLEAFDRAQPSKQPDAE